MMRWNKSVGEKWIDCSRVMVLERRRRVDQRLEVSGWKTKGWSIGRPEILQVSLGRRTELVRRNTELDEM